MSKTIDERVVQMKFDNSNFEGNVKQSMSTIDKLKSALKFDDSSKGLENVSKAAKNVDMSTLGNNVETVRAKFSALEVMAVTALANITNSAVNAGKNIISALTIDPIMTGFEEYETKINAVQTIMSNTASKGTTMEDVTEVLNELNTYADKTIYNFAEMTKNIGTFTAAGVGLEDSAAAIQGIANLAAASGSNSQQASTAMYQLSQALAAGTVKLMDWNSVVNAGMGGEKFQEALKSTAREMGISVDSMIEKAGSFRESLSEGWLSADVLNTTLKKFTVEGATEYAKAMMESGQYTQEMADALIEEAQNMEDAATKVKTFTQLWDTMKAAAQSGWAQTWELIIGDFEEAKDFLTQLSDIFSNSITESANKRNALLEEALGGSTNSWSKISEQIEAAGVDIDTFEEKLIEVGKQHGVITDEMIEQAGSFEKSLKSGWASPDIFKETIETFIDGSTEVESATEDMTAKLEEFQKVVDEVWNGDWGNAPERYQKLADAGYDYAKVQELVNKTVDGHRLTLEDLSIEQAEAIGMTEDEIAVLQDLANQADTTGTSLNDLINDLSKPTGRELLLDSVLNIIEAIGKAINAVKLAWRDVFPATTAEQLYNAIDKFHDFTEWLIMSDEMAEDLRATLRGVFSVLKLITTVIGGALKVAFTALTTAIGACDVNILAITGRVGDAITSFVNWATNVDNLKAAFSNIGTYMSKLGDVFASLFDKLMEIDKVQVVVNTLKSTFGGLFDGLDDYFGNVGTAIQEFINRIKQIDFSNFSLDTVKQILVDFKETVLNTLLNVGDSFDNFSLDLSAIPGNIAKIFTTLASILGKGATTLASVAVRIKDSLRDYISIGDVLAVAFSAATFYSVLKFADAISSLAAPFESLSRVIDSFNKVLKAKAMQIKAEALYSIAKSVLALAAALAVIAAIDSNKLITSLGVITYLAALLVALNIAIKAVDGSEGIIKVGLALAELAIAISLLASALKSIGSMPLEDIAKGMIAIGIAMAAFVAAAKSMSGSGLTDMSSGGVAAIVAMAVAIKLLVSAMKDIGDMDSAAILKSIVGLTEAVIAMRALMAATKNVESGTALPMIAAVISLKLLINTLEDIAKIDTVSLLACIPKYVIIIYLLQSLFRACQNAGEYAIRAGVAIVAMSASLLLIAKAMKSMAELDPDDMNRVAKVVEKLMVIMALLVTVSQYAGKYSIRAGVMIAAMSASFLVLSGAMLILSKLDPDGLDNAVKAIQKLMMMFTIIMAASGLAKSGATTITAISVAIAALASSIAVLSLIDPDALQNATDCMSQVMILLAAIVVCTKYMKTGLSTIITLIAIMGSVAALLIIMSNLDAEASIQNAAAIGILMVAMATILATISKVESVSKKSLLSIQSIMLVMAEIAALLVILDKLDVNTSANNVAGIAALMGTLTVCMAAVSAIKPFGSSAFASMEMIVLVMTEMAAILGILDKLNVEVSMNNVAGIAAMMGTLTVCMAAMSVMKPMGASAFASMEMITLVVAEIAVILGALEKLNIDISMQNVEAIVVMMTAFTTLYGVLGLLGGLSGTAIAGAAGLDAVIAIVGGLMVGVGALATYIPKLEEFATKGIEVLNIVASGIGEFVGNIVGGFAEGVASHLPEVATQLTDFITTLQPFIDGVKNLKSEDLAGLGDLSDAILKITGAEFIEKISSIGGEGGLEGFAEVLADLGEGINDFTNNLSDDVNSEKVQSGVAAIKELAKLYDYVDPIGGLVDAFDGSIDLSEFGKSLGDLGDGINAFAEKCVDMDVDALTTGVEAVQALGELQGALNPIGGLMQGLEGTTNLSKFGDTFKGLGDGLVAFSDACANVNADNVQKGVDAAKPLAELQGSIEPIGGIAKTLFEGSSDLGSFGATIKLLGDGLVAFSDACATVDQESIDKGVAATQALVPLQNSIEPIKGVVQFFSGKTDLGTFGQSLVNFGSGLASFSTSVEGINAEQITNAAAAAKGLTEVLSALPNDDLFTNETWLDDFGAQLPKFGQGLSKFAESISGISGLGNVESIVSACRQLASLAADISGTDFSGFKNLSNALDNFSSDSINKFISAFEGASAKATTAASNLVNAIVSGLTAGQSKVTSTIETMMSGIVTAINSKQSEIDSAGTKLLDGFVSGIENNTSKVTKAFNTTLENAVTAIRAKYSSFESAGEYIVSGLVKGINAKKSSAVAAARELASAVEEASRVTLGVSSPSKVFMEIGKYLVEGLAKGMDKNTNYATTSATVLSRNTVDAMKTALKIESPSKVTRDEVGAYIVDGIAEGIEETTSAEDAAAQKAQNIVNAFKEELDKFDLDATTADLEYQLWEALNSNASDTDKAAMEAELNQKKLAIQAEKAQLAQGEYQTTLKELGADAEETQEAYNKYLQEYISLTEIASDIADSQVTNTIETNRQAYLELNEWLNENAENLQKLGYTMEQIEAAGIERTGYDPNKPIAGEETTNTVAEIVKQAMDAVSGTYATYSETAMAQTLHQFNASGEAMAAATASGVQNGTAGAVAATETMATAVTETVQSQETTWEDTGETLVEQLQAGIENQTPEILETVQTLVDKIQSILDSVNVSSVEDSIDGITASPTITPVVDLSSSTSKLAGSIGSYINLGTATSGSSSTAKSVMSSTSSSSSGSSDSSTTTTTTNYNYTQNNYSPTALSQTDIYRQTSNLIAKLKQSTEGGR